MEKETIQPADLAAERMFGLTCSQQAALVTGVMENYTDWKNARSNLEKTWQECWQAYLCDVSALYSQPDEEGEDRSRIARPVLYESVEAIYAFLMNTLLPADEQFFKVLGYTESDHAQAGAIEDYMRVKLQQCGFYEKFGLFLKQAIITGNSVAAVPWRKKTKKRRVSRPLTVLGVPVGHTKTQQEDIVYDGPDFEVLDIFDVLIDPNTPDFEQAMLIRKLERSLHEMEQSGMYQNLHTLNPQVEPEETHKANKRQSFGIQSASTQQSQQRQQKITLYEAWGDFYMDGTCFENYVCTIANTSWFGLSPIHLIAA